MNSNSSSRSSFGRTALPLVVALAALVFAAGCGDGESDGAAGEDGTTDDAGGADTGALDGGIDEDGLADDADAVCTGGGCACVSHDDCPSG